MILSIDVSSVITNISIILGLAMLVLLVCNYFKIPSVLGFILTGVIAGPGVTNLVKANNDLPQFAEIGVILLLFSIGIEFSLKDLIRIRKQVFVGGGLQLLATSALLAIIFYYFDVPFRESIFLGFLFSLSSTAIVLKVLQETGRLQSPQGMGSMAILIFQDIAIVPLMLLVPYLSAKSEGINLNFFLTILKASLTVGGVLYLSKVLMPRLLFAVAKSRSSELFLLTVLVVCLSVAWVTSKAGLSLSLGAFLAGLIISESEYSHEAFGTIIPFRDLFTSFFFISIGLLVDISFLIDNLFLILTITLFIILLKTLLTGGALLVTGNNVRVALLAGLFVSQVGEFAFVLAGQGLEYKIFSKENYQLFLSVSLVTMAFTPGVIQKSDRLSVFLSNLLINKAIRKRFPRLLRQTLDPLQNIRLKDHLVIIGFGDTGKNIAKVVRMANIPFSAIDSDPEIVLSARAKNKSNVIYGNATTQAVLKHASIQDARVAVIAIGGNKTELKNIILAIKKHAPHVYIITATRELPDIVRLFELGANEVISEQFETSIELITRILSKYLVTRTEIDDFVVKLRSLNYQMMRTIRYEHQGIQDYRLEISDTEILTVKIGKNMPFRDRRINELNLRQQFGISILAVKRGTEITANPPGEMVLQESDILVIFGSHESVDRVSRL